MFEVAPTVFCVYVGGLGARSSRNRRELRDSVLTRDVSKDLDLSCSYGCCLCRIDFSKHALVAILLQSLNPNPRTLTVSSRTIIVLHFQRTTL
jgi:hypothetical protein